MPNPSASPPLNHTELLRDTQQIMDILKEVIHPGNAAQARDGQGRSWPIKLLGTDWQAGLIFWRPHDPQQATVMPGGAPFMSGSLTVEILISVGDGSHLQFEAGRPTILNFSDASVGMVSEFPALLRRETPLDRPA
ncbi:hypothetical protein [Bordetella holmesii]|uniref:N-acetyltransferase YedL n=2 Tax=Bordetella holmesii TaxID=35814 RepID=A0ABN0RXX7_9BORD|nr:hypothetical protein [Bordetella holmesii]AHV94226.1 hypothetical protein D560_3524 [Bordetella holmesii ATCC 51541]AIT28135.1 hypothetical protein D558_3495 [Bordetella holmesii 44057]EWM40919.1 hypothetical protein D555_3564 [Bordetella holmesii 35009]EWM44392.1 hypothetical protein D556_3492 [Bordetella holmesii 41130]EWM44812.1 hypothetical protein D557_2801 [Bordetella holmesii 70147]